MFSLLALIVFFSLPPVLLCWLIAQQQPDGCINTVSYRKLRKELEWRSWQGLQYDDPEYAHQLLLDLQIAEECLKLGVHEVPESTVVR